MEPKSQYTLSFLFVRVFKISLRIQQTLMLYIVYIYNHVYILTVWLYMCVYLCNLNRLPTVPDNLKMLAVRRIKVISFPVPRQSGYVYLHIYITVLLWISYFMVSRFCNARNWMPITILMRLYDRFSKKFAIIMVNWHVSIIPIKSHIVKGLVR